MEFYSATMKNEILSFADKWMELENIILSEVSQFLGSEGQKSHVLPHLQIIDLKQIQYYGTWVTLRGGRTWEGEGKGRKPKT
jgi:hypothetical protein